MIEIDGQKWPTINLADIRALVPEIVIKIESDSKTGFSIDSCASGPIPKPEKQALNDLSPDSLKEWQEYTLDDFSVYGSTRHKLQSLINPLAKMRFEGVITDSKGNSVRVCKGEMTLASLTGMADDSEYPSVWLRSSSNKDEIYYLLKTPSREYQPLFDEFKWSLRLSKIIFNFLNLYTDATVKDTKLGGLLNQHACQKYPDEPWAKWNLFPHIMTHAHSLLDQICFLSDEVTAEIHSHPFWNNPIFETPRKKLTGRVIKTPFYQDEMIIVTPLAHTFFTPIFGDFIKVNKPKGYPKISLKDLPAASAVMMKDFFREPKGKSKYRVLDSDLWCLEDPLGFQEGCVYFNKVLIDTQFVHVGDCVQLRNEDMDIWIARVTSIYYTDPKNPKIKIHWLYKSSDTVLAPIDNREQHFSPKELWYTHHCECKSSVELPLCTIYRKVNVRFNSTWCPDKPHHYFCKSFYSHLTAWFEDLKPAHLEISNRCSCRPPSLAESLDKFKKHAVGDLVHLTHLHTLLTLHEIVSITEAAVELRPLLLLDQLPKEHVSMCLPHKGRRFQNEVVYSETTTTFSIAELVEGSFVKHIETTHLEFYEPSNPLPNNLAHNGAGHHYFFNKVFDSEANILSPLTDSAKFNIIYPPWKSNAKKLATLDLFCGGGSFGHGLEDSGIAECKWAVDVFDSALHTYSVNTERPHTVHYESVNALLKETINNKPRSNWPVKGEVDLIIAGNPCQGFSRLNAFQFDTSSIKKSALLASVASYIEHYRPRFFLMENVANLIRFQYKKSEDSEELLPFNQTIGLFVKLGYQVRWGVIDASSHGLPQIRNRVFIWGAAPGESLPTFPISSHMKSLGGMWGKGVFLPNGYQTDGMHQEEKTAFPKSTIRRAIKDLPKISKKRKFPAEWVDHKTLPVSKIIQDIIDIIPTSPKGSGVIDLLEICPMHPNLDSPYVKKLKYLKRTNSDIKFRDLTRVDPNNVISTVTTAPSYRGFQAMPAVHYSEPRILSLREYARAQGFLDTDVIIGPLRDKHRIVGNAVARPVAFALGLNVKV
ncbi:hypothetical protein CLU79DRAFT_752417 [Phycomyces nitens]|nr:hypothetical protein CLU79DRAFT_752417 [Phycomyces nitens]